MGKRHTDVVTNALQHSRLMTALMTGVLPEMMTPQVSSRMAHWDAPRTRPTCSGVRPVRRSLFAELDMAPRESPYYQHNGGLSTSATEGLTWLKTAFLLPQSAEVYADAGARQR